VFINEWKTGEVFLGDHEDGPLPFCPCLGSDLFSAFMRWAKKNGFMYQGNIQQFIGPISKMTGWTAGKAIPTYSDLNRKERINRKLVIPSLEDLTAAEKLSVPGVKQGPADGRMEWLTAGYYKFKLALPGGNT
jgi:putative DNA primase/helicase